MIVERCNPTFDTAALALASRAWPATEREAYERSVEATLAAGEEQQIVLVAAREGQQLRAAQLGQALPGKAAIVWPPQFAQTEKSFDRTLVAALFERVTNGLLASGVEMVQGLVDPRDESAKLQFESGGFSLAAELLYLVAEAGPQHAAGIDLPITLQPFVPSETLRLAAVIDRTYGGTLDCPQLDGLRKTADVIAGYQAVGQFRPELWFFIQHGGDDVGCLLLNLHPDVGHLEIVYLALVPEVRGRGWGRLLAREALRTAHRADFSRVVLAVDAANAPALQMYERSGFEMFDRRAVWICPLSKNHPKGFL